MADWRKFTGSEEQIKEIDEAKHGWIVRLISGVETNICYSRVDEVLNKTKITEYLICEPHRHAEKIKRWVDTGQPVYWFNEPDEEWQLATHPVWRSSIEYSFNPPKEKQFIEVRDYLYKTVHGEYAKGTANKAFDDCVYIEMSNQFVKWLDDDWWLIEV